MRSLIVEVTDKEGTRFERISLVDQAVSIGRAWDSDIIVQDKFVDADHLSIVLNADQQILVSDLNTTNGTRLAGRRVGAQENTYRLGDVLKIGDTRLKIFDAHESVVPTSLRSKWFLLAERLSSVSALTILTISALAIQAALAYSGANKPFKIEDIVVSSFGVLALLLAWSLILGFISKLLRGESNVKALWVLGCLSIIAANVISIVILIFKFNMQSDNVGEIISVIAFAGFSIWVLAGVLSYTTSLGSRRKWVSSVCVVLGLYGIAESDEYLKEPHQTWSSSTKTEQATLPPALLFRKGVSVDDYMNETDFLF